MSVQAIAWVLEHSAAEHSARLVLLSLANHANDEQLAWCAVSTICRETHLSERAVQGALLTLRKLGEITKLDLHPRYRTNTYALTFQTPQNLHPAESNAESAPEPKASGVRGSVVPEAFDSPSLLKAPTASSKNGLYVSDRVPHFLDKLQAADPRWRKVTIAACVKLAKLTSMDAVTTALSFAATDLPPELDKSAYGWLKATAEGLHEAAVSA